MLSNGKEVYYNFVHLTVQEVLTAIYISRLSASEQISTFDRLFGDSRLGPVLQYYAAITKLRTSRPWLSMLPSWLCPVPASCYDLVRRIIKKEKNVEKFKPKSLSVSLLHCLYEAQDLSLCQFVAEQLGAFLCLSHTSLTPVDCLAIGYFISSVTLTTSDNKVFTVDLSSCSLGDAGTKSLMHSISRHVDPHSTVSTHIDMVLSVNGIHEEGASHIAAVLNNTGIVTGLWLGDWLDENRLSILIGGNPVGDKGVQTILNSLKTNHTLRVLSAASCGMTDTGVASLAEVMNINTTLETLDIAGNHAITDNGLARLVEVLSRRSKLMELGIPRHLKVDEVRKTINEARERRGLGAMQV